MIFFIILTIAIFVFLFFYINAEKFSAGALTQMYAKGPQDHYLTTETDQYIPPYYFAPNWMWNMPTRLYLPYGMYPYYARAYYSQPIWS